MSTITAGPYVRSSLLSFASTGLFVILTNRSALLCCLHTGCFRLEVLDSGVRIVCCLPLVTAATHSWAADKQYSYRQQVWSEQERPIAY